ncbi:DUF4962 domain-containing protein [Aliiruegeria sabulilitoris]|uniref:DUF4962 domain-containing protein n=1 Tax=Aliiruegeria sabulilitoris TaxID=1510458 RepID=UPI00082B3936|nr:DUF4962 domain-containing protein [Aliiruegeria sabulilitoris]NDR59276.1 DUF4962 domain-containing protein [Pseudoruegeria sp. M32A2M]
MTSTAMKDATAYLDEPRAGRLNIHYAPAGGEEVVENPPRFMWLPVVEDDARYVLRISPDPTFPNKTTRVFADIPLNFMTPDVVLEPGAYFWSYAVWDAEAKGPATAWSSVRDFVVPDGVPEVPLAARKSRYSKAEMAHPRLWLGPRELAAFKDAVAADPDHCTWSTFYEKSVKPWIDRPITPEIAPYPNNQRTPPVWRQGYIDCQEVIYAIRHLAIAGQVLGDQALLDKAKDWLLSVAEWDPKGTTSRSYTDEWAFRITDALAWGYDWLYDELTEQERDKVRAALLERTREIADHIIKHANIHLFPYDSHAVRAVYAVLIPCCIAMLGEEEEAREWLDYSIEFLFTVYSPWGDPDGGWAEGPHYWMTAMAYLIDGANYLKNFTGLDLYQRPFFKNTGYFPLYTKPADTRRGTFGDDSTMGDQVCLKVAYNLRQYAGVTGNGAFQWYYDEVKKNDPGTEGMFYNYGWWDLNFDEMCYRHDWPTVAAEPPSDAERLKWFKGVGWASIQHRMGNPDEHISFIFKSSPFGSISHSHGDQNAFCMSAFGEDLAVQSGYYIGFNTSMHRNWRRQTRSKNAILINGKGQYADRDKAMTARATGKLITAEERGDHFYIKGDATEAYKVLSPEVTKVEREVYFVHDSYFVLVDNIDAEEPVSIDWLCHANGPFQLGSDSFRYTGERAGYYGKLLYSEAGAPTLTQQEGYQDVDPAEIEGLPVGSNVRAAFPKAMRHRIATVLVPYPKDAPRRVFNFIDDQGYDCDIYLTDADERSFKVVVQKLMKA